MTTIKCNECGADVSDTAKSCPKCGAPVKKRPPVAGMVGAAAVAVILLATLGHILAGDKSTAVQQDATPAAASTPDQPAQDRAPTDQAATAPSPAPPQPAVYKAPSCVDDYRACRDNEDLVNHYSKEVDAAVACKRATDDHVRFGEPDWPWLPFGRFRVGSTGPARGFIDLVENDVKIQNQFGAMMHSQVHCRYDLAAQKVVMIDVNDEDPIVLDDALWQKSLNEPAEEQAAPPMDNRQASAVDLVPAVTVAPPSPAGMMTNPMDINLRACAGVSCAPVLVIPKGSRLSVDPANIQNVTEQSGAQTPWVKVTFNGMYCPVGSDCQQQVQSQMPTEGWVNYKVLKPVD